MFNIFNHDFVCQLDVLFVARFLFVHSANCIFKDLKLHLSIFVCTEKNLAQMLPLAVELLRLAEESCATMHLGMLRSLCGWAAAPFWGSSWLTFLSGGAVVAPHRQANAKAGESTNLKFFMIYMKVPIEMMFPVYILKYFLVHYDLFTNNLTSMLRFQIISHHLKKLNKFFKRYNN